MRLNRTSSSVAVGLLALILVTPCFGQGPGPTGPAGPLGYQYFAQPDVSTYGTPDIEPNEGYFFQVDFLWWSISQPDVHPVGFPSTRTVFYGVHPTSPLDPQSDIRIQSNTLDSSIFNGDFSPGDRIEFGHVQDGNGIFCSIYQLRDQTQEFNAPSADMVFNDPAFGPRGQQLLQGNVNANTSQPAIIQNLPVTFYNLSLFESINTWGVEVNYLHRFRTCHLGGTFEMFVGPRYFEFNDNFNVVTGSGPAGIEVPSFLAGSFWNTSAENHVVGPQVGLRWFKKQGRWMFSTEGRFLAGINYQNLSQQVSMGPNLNPNASPGGTNTTPPPTPFQPLTMAPTTATHVVYEREFTPALELRVEARYQLTRAISLHAGWTGWWMDNIARASSVIDYTVPAMGINASENRETLFINGVTVGLDINR
jgi:hypothetical protein